MRYEDWPARLNAFLADEQPFEWGRRDCTLFAADAVLCITGIDPAKPWRGRYKTAIGAARIQKAHGGLAELVAQAGLEEVRPTMAQRGDVVLIQSTDGPTLAVVNLSGNVSGQGQSGVTVYPIKEATRAWRVG